MRTIISRTTIIGNPTSSDQEILAEMARMDAQEREEAERDKAAADATRKRRRGEPKGIPIKLS